MGNKTTQTARADPWQPARAPLQAGLTEAGAIYNRGGFQTNPYAGDMVANFTPDQLRANQMTRDATRGQIANIQGAQDIVKGVQKQGYYNGLQGAIGNMQNATETGDFRRGVNTAMDQSMSNDYIRAANANLNAGVDPRLTSGVANAQDMTFNSQYGTALRHNMNTGNSGQFNRAVSGAMNAEIDPRLAQGINTAQNTGFDSRFDTVTGQARGNDARFDSTINRETDPNAGLYMTNALRRNIIEGIAPQISSTFGKSGMANSGLHAVNLVKGLSSGLAPVEYQIAADQRNRALQAAGMAQGAYETGANFDMNAAQARQGALDTGRSRALAAGIAGQNAEDVLRNARLTAGNMDQAALQARLARQMAAGESAQGATERGRALGLTAGQAANSAREAALARQIHVGTTTQSFQDAARARALQAGTAVENATRNRLSEALRAGQVGQSAMDTNESQALQAASAMPALNRAYYDPINQLRNVGQYEQTQNQNEINANILRDQQQQAASADAIERYMALVSGVGGQFGVNTSTSQQRPGLLSMLGTGLQMLPFIP